MKELFKICFLILVSCTSSNKEINPKNNNFNFPITIQRLNIDSLEKWKTEGINEIFPKFIGQYNFADTVNFDDERQRRYIDEKQYKWEQNIYSFDTLSSDGLEIYPDYKNTVISKFYNGTSITKAFFPIYVVNRTSDPKLFIAKDDYVFAIQEAVDTSDYNSWYAIEARGFDFCGNGYFRRKLLPKQFIVFLMPKYSGPDTTFMRTRIQIGENIILSKPYKGNFDKHQFQITKRNIWQKDLKTMDYKWMFYGAQNKE